MALKVTALTYIRTLKELNAGQKRIYDMFVEIAGSKFNAHITKPQVTKLLHCMQVKEYCHNKLSINATDEEIDEFFKVGKTDSTDKDANILTAVEYIMNMHGFPVYAPLKSTLVAKIANYKVETINDLTDWIKRITSILESIKRANVS